MAINYDKYILSTGTHYISNSGKDERNQYKGGAAGDQSGHEWELKGWYSRPWTVVLRWPDPAVGLKMAQLGIAAALNNKIGYDQYQRTTYWTQLQKAGYDPSKITTPCEEDCTAGVTANCKAVGFLLDIKALKDLPTSVYSGSMRSVFVRTGFLALTDKKYLNNPNYLLPGDVLLYEGHHAAMNITYGKNVRPSAAPTAPTVEGLQRGDKGDDVRAMQRALLAWDADCLPRYGADGDFGSETVKAVKDFQASVGLPETGIYDEATRKALTGVKPAEPEEPDEDTLGEIGDIDAFLHLYVRVTGDSVNVRSAPGINAGVLGVAHRGDLLVYQGEKSAVDGRDWYLVDYHNENGWVSSKYSRVE